MSPKMKKALTRLGILLGAVILMFLLALLLTVFIQNDGEESSSQAIQPATSQPEPEPEPEPEPDWNTVGPQQQDVNNMQLTGPTGEMLVLPENGRVDMSYFDTVTFVGDSLTQGFQIYQEGIPNAQYCAYKGISPKGIYDGTLQTKLGGEREIPMDALVASQPDNVYVLLGANAMTHMTNETILAYYTEMLVQMKTHLPDEVYIYVQSITAVREDNEPELDMQRINELNTQLAQLAFDQNVYFLNINEVLAAEDGFLREEFAAKDGYHLNTDGYLAWKEYLVTHTAYHDRNPYLEGSPYYIAGAE